MVRRPPALSCPHCRVLAHSGRRCCSFEVDTHGLSCLAFKLFRGLLRFLGDYRKEPKLTMGLTESVVNLGDTDPLATVDGEHSGLHFVSFVKGDDGHLWELEGSRKSPIDRGALREEEDVLSPRALRMGLKRVIKLVQAAGIENLNFSCTVLAPKL